MSLITSQITSLTTVYSTAYSDADQRKHQSPASLAFVRGIHRGPVNSPHKGLVTRKMFPFDDVIMFVDGTTRFHTKSNPGRWLTLETISSGLHMLSSRHFYCEYAQRIWRNHRVTIVWWLIRSVWSIHQWYVVNYDSNNDNNDDDNNDDDDNDDDDDDDDDDKLIIPCKMSCLMDVRFNQRCLLWNRTGSNVFFNTFFFFLRILTWNHC